MLNERRRVEVNGGDHGEESLHGAVQTSAHRQMSALSPALSLRLTLDAGWRGWGQLEGPGFMESPGQGGRRRIPGRLLG